MGQKVVEIFDANSEQVFMVTVADRAEFEAKCVSAGLEIYDSGCSCGKCGLVFISEDKFVPATDTERNLFGALPPGMDIVKAGFGDSVFYAVDFEVVVNSGVELAFKVYEATTL